jgi:hypothetical protein
LESREGNLHLFVERRLQPLIVCVRCSHCCSCPQASGKILKKSIQQILKKLIDLRTD